MKIIGQAHVTLVPFFTDIILGLLAEGRVIQVLQDVRLVVTPVIRRACGVVLRDFLLEDRLIQVIHLLALHFFGNRHYQRTLALLLDLLKHDSIGHDRLRDLSLLPVNLLLGAVKLFVQLIPITIIAGRRLRAR